MSCPLYMTECSMLRQDSRGPNHQTRAAHIGDGWGIEKYRYRRRRRGPDRHAARWRRRHFSVRASYHTLLTTASTPPVSGAEFANTHRCSSPSLHQGIWYYSDDVYYYTSDIIVSSGGGCTGGSGRYQPPLASARCGERVRVVYA